MLSKKRHESKLGIYHVILQGIGKYRIFEEQKDYERFLRTLHVYQCDCSYKIYAYCLMSNHVHLLIKPGEKDLASIFRRICPSFVRWYNAKYQRVGSLFQSPYWSKPVNDEVYFLTVLRYIHQNPVKAGICSDPFLYEYSSLRQYFANDLIDPSIVKPLISEEYFYSFNRAENDDHCMDIDGKKPWAISDERAVKIMQNISGCKTSAGFNKLDRRSRDEALREMHMAGIPNKQASRISGISYGVVKKVCANL